MAASEQVPVAEGLFTWSGRTASLIGTRCASCNTHYFPKSLSCRNPNCKDKKVEDALLGPTGTLYSYTVQEYQPPPLFRMDPWTPYAIGLVELPQGIRVLGMLTGVGAEQIRIGMDVELTVEPLYRDDQGREVVTYKFKPVGQP